MHHLPTTKQCTRDSATSYAELPPESRQACYLKIGGNGIFRKIDAIIWTVIQDHMRRLQ